MPSAIIIVQVKFYQNGMIPIQLTFTYSKSTIIIIIIIIIIIMYILKQISRLLTEYQMTTWLTKVFNNNNTRKKCEICANLTIKTAERRQWRHSNVFIVNFEHISSFFLMFLLTILNKYMLAGWSSKIFSNALGRG